jgi:excisionase family DNA binding protein
VKTAAKLLVTIPEAQAMLSVSRASIYALMNRGELAWVKIGKSRRIRVDSLTKLVDRNTMIPG